MPSPADNIKNLLRALGIETTGWVIRVGRFPTSPDRVLVVADSGGGNAEPSLLIDYPTVQLRTRGDAGGTSYPDAYAKLESARTVLLGIPEAPAQYPELVSVTQRGHISWLGYDDSDRPMFSLNLQLIVEPAPTVGGHRV